MSPKLLSTWLFLLVALPAGAEEVRPLLEQDGLSEGVLGRQRAALAEKGVTVHLEYRAEVLGNVVSGIRTGATYQALVDAWTEVDFGMLLGWTVPEAGETQRSLGPTLRVRGIYPHGKGISEQYVGDLGITSGTDFYDSTRLFELWLQQPLGRFATARAGLMAVDEEFALSNHASLFLHAGFGPPTALSGNFPVPVYAISALGIRLEVNPCDGVVARFGVFDGNPASGVFGDPSSDARASSEQNHFNTHWALRDEEGAFLIGEIGYEFNQPGEDEPPAATCSSKECASPAAKQRGLAGRYVIGGMFHTDGFSDAGDVALADLGSSLAPATARERERNWGLYFVAEQEIFREQWDAPGNGHADVFLRGTFTPEDRNFFQWSIEAGLHYTGILPSRDQDELGIGAGCFCVSDDVRRAYRRAGAEIRGGLAEPDYEAVIEVTYKINVSPWLSIQPDVQYIIQPGADGALDNALVIGLRSSVVF